MQLFTNHIFFLLSASQYRRICALRSERLSGSRTTSMKLFNEELAFLPRSIFFSSQEHNEYPSAYIYEDMSKSILRAK